jgi:glycosyltransferase involved in cell wall biosynthesis
MKVVISGHSADIAGAELSLVYIVKRLEKAGHQCIVTLPRRGALVGLLQKESNQVQIEYVPTHWWMGKRQSGLVGLLRLLQSLLDAIPHLVFLLLARPGLVIVISSVTPGPLIAGRLLSIPVALTLGESLRSNPTLQSLFPKALITQIINWAANLVLPCSDYVAGQYGYPCEVLYPEIDLAKFKPPPQKKINLRMPLKLAIFGTLSSEKGQQIAIESVGILKEKGVTAYLDIWGAGPSRETKFLYSLISKFALGTQIRVRGHCNDPAVEMPNYDSILVCSGNEAFGKVTLEALAVGVPVVGANFGGTAEILSQGGGRLVERNSEAFAAEIAAIDKSRVLLRTFREEAINSVFIRDGLTTRKNITQVLSGFLQ